MRIQNVTKKSDNTLLISKGKKIRFPDRTYSSFSLLSGCPFLSVNSPSASSLYLKWSGYAGASVYLLDLRVVNSTSIAPLVVLQTAPSTERRIQGLRPGSFYQVTLKVFEFYNIVCTNVEITTTGNDLLYFFSCELNKTKHQSPSAESFILYSLSACHIPDHLFQSSFQYIYTV